MTIRIIVRQADEGAAMHVGGPVNVSHRTFDLALPELEQYLRADGQPDYIRREVIGVELLEPAPGVPPCEAPSKITSLAEFCAEGQRLGLTAFDLAEALKDRPEFADCKPASGVTPCAGSCCDCGRGCTTSGVALPDGAKR